MMGVLFRTGENTAASVSWPVYFFFVLPFQLLYGFAKMLVLGFKWIGVALLALGSLVVAGVRRARGHAEERPPAA